MSDQNRSAHYIDMKLEDSGTTNVKQTGQFNGQSPIYRRVNHNNISPGSMHYHHPHSTYSAPFRGHPRMIRPSRFPTRSPHPRFHHESFDGSSTRGGFHYFRHREKTAIAPYPTTHNGSYHNGYGPKAGRNYRHFHNVTTNYNPNYNNNNLGHNKMEQHHIGGSEQYLPHHPQRQHRPHHPFNISPSQTNTKNSNNTSPYGGHENNLLLDNNGHYHHSNLEFLSPSKEVYNSHNSSISYQNDVRFPTEITQHQKEIQQQEQRCHDLNNIHSNNKEEYEDEDDDMNEHNFQNSENSDDSLPLLSSQKTTSSSSSLSTTSLVSDINSDQQSNEVPTNTNTNNKMKNNRNEDANNNVTDSTTTPTTTVVSISLPASSPSTSTSSSASSTASSSSSSSSRSGSPSVHSLDVISDIETIDNVNRNQKLTPNKYLDLGYNSFDNLPFSEGLKSKVTGELRNVKLSESKITDEMKSKYMLDDDGFIEAFVHGQSANKINGKGTSDIVSSYGVWFHPDNEKNLTGEVPQTHDRKLGKSAFIIGTAKAISIIKNEVPYNRVHLKMETTFILDNLTLWISDLKDETSFTIKDWNEKKYFNEIRELCKASDGMLIKCTLVQPHECAMVKKSVIHVLNELKKTTVSNLQPSFLLPFQSNGTLPTGPDQDQQHK